MNNKWLLLLLIPVVIILVIVIIFLVERSKVDFHEEDGGTSISIIGGADGPTSIFLAGKIGGNDSESNIEAEDTEGKKDHGRERCDRREHGGKTDRFPVQNHGKQHQRKPDGHNDAHLQKKPPYILFLLYDNDLPQHLGRSRPETEKGSCKKESAFEQKSYKDHASAEKQHRQGVHQSQRQGKILRDGVFCYFRFIGHFQFLPPGR